MGLVVRYLAEVVSKLFLVYVVRQNTIWCKLLLLLPCPTLRRGLFSRGFHGLNLMRTPPPCLSPPLSLAFLILSKKSKRSNIVANKIGRTESFRWDNNEASTTRFVDMLGQIDLGVYRWLVFFRGPQRTADSCPRPLGLDFSANALLGKV